MKSRLFLIMTAGALLPLLFCFNRYYTSAPMLATCVDIENADEILPDDATSGDVIDTISVNSKGFKEENSEENRKKKEVVELVNDAINFVQKNSFDSAMNAFTHGREFIRGELYIFVYNMLGVEEANGQDERFVWKNLSNLQDTFGTYIVRELINIAKAGGGWLTYQWRNATKVSYVKTFTKDGKEYVIGSGYYPHSKHDVVVGLVKAAVAYFNNVVHEKGFPVDEVFSTLSFPAGRFVMGDLYLYAVDFNGVMLANGNRPGLIGTNVLQVKDANGKFTNQEIINKLKNTQEGVWVEYRSKNANKLTYAQKVSDKNGKEYFIACGYYPEATPNRAVDLVKDAYEFLKRHGLSAAVQEFSSRQSDRFRLGDLYITLWNMKGVVIADGANLDMIGINQYDLKDEDGRFYVQEIIKKADAGGGWVDFKLKNAFQSIYVEKVDLGTDSYIVASGLYPISKREIAVLLARSAAGYLRTNPDEIAFSEFTDANGKFIRGDLYVFVIDFDGIVKVWGDSYELIWRNIMDAKDDAGKPYIQIFINTVKQGPGQVTYKINGRERIALLEMVEKEGKAYVVGTGYYL